MLISVFKRNLFFNSLLLLPLAMVIRSFSLYFTEKTNVYEKGDILYQFVLKILPENRLYHSLISIFLVFIIAVLINRLVIKNRIANEITLLPGLFFVLLTSLTPELLGLSPIQFGLLFIVLALSNLYKSYKKFNSELYLFNTGFYLGISVLFSSNLIVFVIPFIFGFFSIRSYNFREFMQLLSGVLAVAYFYTIYLLWTGDEFSFTPFTYNSPAEYFSGNISVYFISIIYGVLLAMLLMTYRKFIIKKSIQSQKKVNILLWILIFAIICMGFINPEFKLSYFYILAFGLSYFTSAIFLRIKNKMISEIVYVLIVFSILIFHFQYYF